MDFIKQNIDKYKDRYIEELLELLRIPSVSADPKYKEACFATAEAVSHKMKDAGLDNVEIMSTPGFPVVYGEKMIDKNLPTILVYGHYDVQPADPLNLWHSPPFEPIIKDEKIFARGACDDKGQMFMHVKALEIMLENNALPCNVKMIVEGEEEVGSDNLGEFIAKYKEKLACDVVLVSDTSIIANDVPSVTVGLRGLCYMEVEVTGPNRDLHSGVYGGAVPNPINALCEMIAKMKDENDHITIEKFYDDVIELSENERKAMNEAPFSLDDYKRDLKLADIRGEKGYTTLERTSIRPTIDVNGIWGGYIGEGAKTVLPSKAFAKISMRLVPNQSSEKIAKLFEDYFIKIAPPSVHVSVKAHHGGEPVVTPTDSVAYKAAEKAMETTFGKKPIPQRGGGSIPIVALFEAELNAKTVLMGFGLDSDDIHSPNEHYGIFNFLKGIETIPYFYKYYAEMF
ncbi:MAG: dipeptidase [Bacteroidetes bacterium]|nr:dipeptidase [Bacteroidota bacterium]MBK9633159.1 dipeptidase [Bacteroidota bacterium]MBL0077616.1 dipeptidase [Bacteroidota bacterium]MBP7255852.1 dipeptidase [Chitinophagales bacterium]